MSFSYDPDGLASPLNHLRFLIQDTEDAGHLFEDAEIQFAGNAEPNVFRVAATLCRSAAMKVIQQPAFDDDITVWKPEEKAKVYLQLAASYDKKADQDSTTDIDPSALALNVADASGNDTMRAFTRDLHLQNN